MAKQKRKKLWKWLAIAIAFPLILLILLSLLLMLVVDKEMVIGKLEALLSRHITAGDASAGIFSSVSGLEVRDIRISNFKSAQQLKNLQGKPVAADDLFLEIKSVSLKVKLLPLLFKRIELKKLEFNEPYLHLVLHNDGSYNFADLLGQETKTEARPLTVDDLPMTVSLGKIEVADGKIDHDDRQSHQTTRLDGISLIVQSLEIDSSRLADKNGGEIRIKSGLKSLGQFYSGGFKSFDLLLAGQAIIKPFSLQTRKLDPEINARLESPRGVIKGLKIMARIKTAAELTRYCGGLDFLKEDLEWKNGRCQVTFRQGWFTLAGGSIGTADWQLSFSGKSQLGSGLLDLDLGILMDARYTPLLRSGIRRNVDSLLSGKFKKYVFPETITDQALKAMVNPDGKIFLEFKVSGTWNAPRPMLVHPRLPSLAGLVEAAVQDYLRRNKDTLIEQGGKLLRKFFKQAA